MNTSNGQKTAVEIDERTAHEADVESEEWQEAREWVRDLQGLVQGGEVPADTVGRIATRWGVSRATVWRRIHRYQQSGNLSGLLPRRPGRKPGVATIDAKIDSVIRECARRWWRQTENATIAEIEPSVVKACVSSGLRPPSRATIARRLRQLRRDPDNFSGEVRTALRERRRLMRSSYVVERPLDVVQIDHTVADVFIVDPVSRECIGRPTLTIAIDVATRCVLGHCLSLEAPSALLVALCLEQAVFPKADWLAALGLSAEYPMYGLPKALHCDNGAEFHGAAFRRGCDLTNIDTLYRPPGTPRFGGHIERLIGTFMRRVRLLPGNSYSAILGRRLRGAESAARLTLRDLELYLAEEIIRYHHRSHRGLGMSPQRAWEQGGSRVPEVIGPTAARDRLNFRARFLPVRHRVVGREGIELFGLKYGDGNLAPYVAPGTQRVVRFDPRDLSRIYLELGATEHLCVPLRDRRLPAFSLWEWHWMQRHRRPGALRADPEAIGLEMTRPVFPMPSANTPLQGRRRAARTAEWREWQRLQALPAPRISLEPTLTAPATGEDLAWEILE